MKLRKINAVLSLLSTVLLLDHAIFLSVWMLSGCTIQQSATNLPWLLVWLMAAHAALSIALGILGHKGAEKRECKEYPQMNIPTIMQRFSGILMLPLTTLHVLGTVGILHPPKLVHTLLPPVFFAIVLAHTAVSVSKALITLGIGSAKFIKTADIIAKALCAATLLASVIGFIPYSAMGVG